MKGFTTLRDLPAKLCCAPTAKLVADLDAGSSDFVPRIALICFLICLLRRRAFSPVSCHFLRVKGSWSLVVEAFPTSRPSNICFPSCCCFIHVRHVSRRYVAVRTSRVWNLRFLFYALSSRFFLAARCSSAFRFYAHQPLNRYVSLGTGAVWSFKSVCPTNAFSPCPNYVLFTLRQTVVLHTV